jgi:hypothetical protein
VLSESAEANKRDDISSSFLPYFEVWSVAARIPEQATPTIHARVLLLPVFHFHRPPLVNPPTSRATSQTVYKEQKLHAVHCRPSSPNMTAMEETDLHASKWVDSEKAASSASSSKSSPQLLRGHPRPTGPSPRWTALRRQFLDDRIVRLSNACVILFILFCIARIATNISIQFASPLPLSEAEKIILNSPSPDFIRNQSYIYTSGAHIAGKNKTQAIYTRDLWESYGIKTEIETFEVLLNYPVSHRLALLHNGTVEFEAALREDVIPEDPTSLDPDQVPTFHGYSANGNVTGELVYANFGKIDDFEALVKHGVNVSGKVVIMRYGDTFRGLKVKAAQGKL